VTVADRGWLARVADDLDVDLAALPPETQLSDLFDSAELLEVFVIVEESGHVLDGVDESRLVTVGDLLAEIESPGAGSRG
jgi:hypothetical protein